MGVLCHIQLEIHWKFEFLHPIKIMVIYKWFFFFKIIIVCIFYLNCLYHVNGGFLPTTPIRFAETRSEISITRVRRARKNKNKCIYKWWKSPKNILWQQNFLFKKLFLFSLYSKSPVFLITSLLFLFSKYVQTVSIYSHSLNAFYLIIWNNFINCTDLTTLYLYTIESLNLISFYA